MVRVLYIIKYSCVCVVVFGVLLFLSLIIVCSARSLARCIKSALVFFAKTRFERASFVLLSFFSLYVHECCCFLFLTDQIIHT